MNRTAKLYLSDAVTCLKAAMEDNDETQIAFAKYKIDEAERELQDRRRIAAQHAANTQPGCPCVDCRVARSQASGGAES